MRSAWLALGFALWAPCAWAQADQLCPGPTLPVGATPGLLIGAYLSEAQPGQVPRSSGCYVDTGDHLDQCTFLGRSGYRYYFSGFDPMRADGGRDRILFSKEALRANGARLPYGVLWSDSQAKVAQKIRAQGAKPSGWEDGGLSVGGCYGNREADGFWTEFAFDREGRLTKVEQKVQFP